MVYCGKPSRGCQMCRTRRIKCDETKPTCLQCQKSRRQCPGYKDDFDLVFRNETQATERRARRSINSKKIKFDQRNRNEADGSASASGSRNQGELVPGSNAASPGSVPASVTIPLEMQAFHYFLSNYVLVPQVGTTRGHLSYVLPLLKGEPGGTQLSTSFTAVALASFGNRPGASRLLPRARLEYIKALSYVNKSLQNPVTQKSNQTLASILLLGLYETITTRRTNLGSWGTHIEGAVMLIRMRGRKQLQDPIGKSLFVAIRSQMLINCLSASKAPDLGVEWWTKGAARDDVAAHEASRLNLLTCELRADVNQAMTLMPRTPENFDKTRELIRRAQEIEQGFLDWEASLPDEWRFNTVAWADTIPDSDLSISEVYPGKVDMFSDLFVASQWNMARVARLILSGIIIRCAAWIWAPVDYRTTSHYAQASRIGIEMINDIVASIPYHLGWRGFRNNSEESPTTGNISSFVCGRDEIGTGKPLGAYFLIWPVFTSIVSDFATDAQRKYIIGRMKYMTDVMGINGAAVLTQFQLRLPSMIVKRDLMCMFTAASKPAAYASKPSATPPGPPAPPSSTSRTSSFSTYKPSELDSRIPSISTSPVTFKASSLSPIGPGIKEEDEEEILEAQAQMEPDYEKKRAEKEAFSRTYGPAIKETSGDNMEYLHPESGQDARPIELVGT